MRQLSVWLVLLVGLFILHTSPVTADSTLDAPPTQGAVKGQNRPAVFATYARVERDTYTYSAPNGERVQFLEGNQSWWISVKERQTVGGELWYRTDTGRWVRASDVRILPSARFRGAYWNGLYDDGAMPQQFGFILNYDTHVHDTPDPDANDLDFYQKYSWVPLYGMQNGWWNIGDNAWIWQDFVRPVRWQPRPAGVGPNDKWIDINLTQQTVAAYEGDRMVFATLTSTGKRTTPTVTGLFAVHSKYITHTMKGMSETGTYYLEEVPWTLYFHQAYALHGAYWHDGFGAIRSAGCVNLSPVDARWLFNWAGPVLPAGMNYIASSAANPGTWVYSHY